MPNADIARGANYIPAASHHLGNADLYLTASGRRKFPFDVVQDEARFLQQLGCRHVRMFQSFWTYMVNRDEHLENLGETARILKDRGVGILLTLLEGVVAYGSWADGADSQLNSPWYDLLGQNGNQRWDPTARTNPDLLNGTDGLLDAWIQAQFNEWYNVNQAYRDFVGGGHWFPAPDPLYMTSFDMRPYPALGPIGHEDFWQAIKDYITDTIQVVKDEGILDAVDCFNEPSISVGDFSVGNHLVDITIFALNQSGQVANPQMFAELGPNFLVDATARFVQVVARYGAHIDWVLRCVKDVHPDVLRTCGHVSFFDNITLHGDSPNLFIEAPDFISGHNYGYAWRTEEEISQWRANLDAHVYLNGKRMVLNEFFRNDAAGGDRGLLPTLHLLAKYGHGGYMWDIFETPTFASLDIGYTNKIGAQPQAPANMAFPNTGYARSLLRGGTSQIIRRREDLYPYMTEWFQGEDQQLQIDPPEQYRVQRIGYRTYGLVDLHTGQRIDLLPTDNVYYRWLIVDDADITDRDPTNFQWAVSDTWHSLYLMAGRLLDSPNEQRLIGHDVLDLSGEDLSGLTAGKQLIIHAVHGNREWMPDPFFEEMLYWETVPLFLNLAEFSQGTKPIGDVKILVHNALIKAAKEHPFKEVTYDQDGYMVEGGVLFPTSIVANDVDASFGQPERYRRGHAVDYTAWTWELRITFPREVSLHTFETFKQVGSSILIKKTANTRQVRLDLQSVRPEHPVKGSPESGTSAVYTYNAVLAPAI